MNTQTVAEGWVWSPVNDCWLLGVESCGAGIYNDGDGYFVNVPFWSLDEAMEFAEEALCSI